MASPVARLWRLDIVKARSASEGPGHTRRLRSGLSMTRLAVTNSRFVSIPSTCRMKRSYDPVNGWECASTNKRVSTLTQKNVQLPGTRALRAFSAVDSEP